MSTDLLTYSRDLTRDDPADLDLTDPGHLNRTYEVADALLDSGADQGKLRQLLEAGKQHRESVGN